MYTFIHIKETRHICCRYLSATGKVKENTNPTETFNPPFSGKNTNDMTVLTQFLQSV